MELQPCGTARNKWNKLVCSSNRCLYITILSLITIAGGNLVRKLPRKFDLVTKCNIGTFVWISIEMNFIYRARLGDLETILGLKGLWINGFSEGMMHRQSWQNKMTWNWFVLLLQLFTPPKNSESRMYLIIQTSSVMCSSLKLSRSTPYPAVCCY